MTERRTHFRGRARAGRRVDLEYRIAADDDSEPWLTAVTRDIGVGGAFIFTDAPAAVGTQLALRLKVPTADEPIVAAAEVRWVVAEPSATRPRGMGVKFDALDVDALLSLSEYFASLTHRSDSPGPAPGETA